MKKILLILFMQSCFIHSFSQNFKKYAIGNSGCAAYFFCDPGTFGMDYSEDSAKVYPTECNSDQTSYGMICIQLKASITDISNAENVLVTYLDYLKKTFKIKSSAGYGKGHRLKNQEDTRGIIDYWQDDEKNNWKVKGWTNGKFIAVLYAYSKNDLPETKVNLYLDGLLFSGM